MASKLFRCENPKCADAGRPLQFSSDIPKCPKCGIEAKDPRPGIGKVIVRLPSIHFDPSSEVPGYGKGHWACDPTKGIAVDPTPIPMLGGMVNPFHVGSGNPAVVNCPECRATKAWEDAMAAAYADEDGTALRAAMARVKMFIAV